MFWRNFTYLNDFCIFLYLVLAFGAAEKWSGRLVMTSSKHFLKQFLHFGRSPHLAMYVVYC